MKPPVFDYERPSSLRAALEALSQHGGKAKLLAGGHSLIPMLNMRAIAPARLIDVGRLSELQYIIEEYGQLRIGALTTHNAILRSPIVAANCPIMTEAYRARRQSFHPQPRHARRQPLSQRSRVRDAAGRHAARGDDARAQRALQRARFAAERFFKAPFATDLAADEMLVEIRVPRLPPGHGYSFLEVSQRYGDRALIAAGCLSDLALRHLP